jgi:hypothetical protein
VAWAAVVAAWNEDAAHKAYLARFGDLEGLAAAGRRYREVLSRHPSDPVAIKYRDEIVKRATVQGLAMLPRTAPKPPLPRWVKWAIISVGSSVAASVLWRVIELMGRAGP